MACSQLMDDCDLARFRTKACQRHVSGNCEFEKRCQYSHSPGAQRRCPFLLLKKEPLTILRYLPMYCDNMKAGPNGGSCSRGNGCPFAHSDEEVLYHPLIYKQKLCPYLDALKKQDVVHCPQYYCPFVHDLSERRHLQRSTYFLAPSFVKKVVLHLPQPLSLIPVSMLNTGKLTELKAVPEDLLESLLVSKAVEAMKTRSLAEDEWMTALGNNDLHHGSLCLVGVPFEQGSHGHDPGEDRRKSADDLSLQKSGLRSPTERREQKTEGSFAQLLALRPGEVVEILASFPVGGNNGLEEMSFYGRTGTLPCREGWFPGSVLMGVMESNRQYRVTAEQGLLDGVLSLNESTLDYSMLTPIPQRLVNSISKEETSGGSIESDLIPSELGRPSDWDDIQLALHCWVPTLQKLCGEIEGFLVLELVQEMLTTPPGLRKNQAVDMGELRHVAALVNQIQTSLNHLETVTAIKLLRRQNIETTTINSPIKLPHRISGASTHSGTLDSPQTIYEEYSVNC